VPTTGITLVREQTETMRVPRFLWVPFELGRPFGAPHERDFQRRVLHDALALLDRSDVPVIADFPDDAPASTDEAAWACPVSFARDPVGEPDLVDAVRAEMRRLTAWAELAPSPAPNSALGLDEMVSLLGRLADGEDASELLGDRPVVEVVRLAADDLRTWYLHAATRQPGASTAAERTTWFWRQTALAQLLGALAARLLDDPDPILRMFADRGLVPRDHWSAVVHDAPTGAPDD